MSASESFSSKAACPDTTTIADANCFYPVPACGNFLSLPTEINNLDFEGYFVGAVGVFCCREGHASHTANHTKRDAGRFQFSG